MSALVDDSMDLAPVPHAGRDLHRAARLGDCGAIDDLVRLAGVNPNLHDPFDATPLYLAAYCGHQQAVITLLSLGARCDPDTFDGERAVYGALTDEIARILRNASAVTRQRGPLYSDLARLWQASRAWSDEMIPSSMLQAADVDSEPRSAKHQPHGSNAGVRSGGSRGHSRSSQASAYGSAPAVVSARFSPECTSHTAPEDATTATLSHDYDLPSAGLAFLSHSERGSIGLEPDLILRCAGTPPIMQGPCDQADRVNGYEAPVPREDAGRVAAHAVVVGSGSGLLLALVREAASRARAHLLLGLSIAPAQPTGHSMVGNQLPDCVTGWGEVGGALVALPRGGFALEVALPSPGIGDVGKETLEALVAYCYTDRATVARRLLPEASRLANQLGLHLLAERLDELIPPPDSSSALLQKRAARSRGRGRGQGRARGLSRAGGRAVEGSVVVTVDLSPASYVIGSPAESAGLFVAGDDRGRRQRAGPAGSGGGAAADGEERGVRRTNGVPWFKAVPGAKTSGEAEGVLRVRRARRRRKEQAELHKLARALGGEGGEVGVRGEGESSGDGAVGSREGVPGALGAGGGRQRAEPRHLRQAASATGSIDRPLLATRETPVAMPAQRAAEEAGGTAGSASAVAAVASRRFAGRAAPSSAVNTDDIEAVRGALFRVMPSAYRTYVAATVRSFAGLDVGWSGPQPTELSRELLSRLSVWKRRVLQSSAERRHPATLSWARRPESLNTGSPTGPELLTTGDRVCGEHTNPAPVANGAIAAEEATPQRRGKRGGRRSRFGRTGLGLTAPARRTGRALPSRLARAASAAGADDGDDTGEDSVDEEEDEWEQHQAQDDEEEREQEEQREKPQLHEDRGPAAVPTGDRLQLPTLLEAEWKPLRARLACTARAGVPPRLWRRRHHVPDSADDAAVNEPCAYSTDLQTHVQPDLVIVAGSARFRVHRKLLMARSPYLRTMLCSDFAEAHTLVASSPLTAAVPSDAEDEDVQRARALVDSIVGPEETPSSTLPELEFQGMAPSVLAAIVVFVYCDELIRLQPSRLSELILGADLFSITDLRAAAVQLACRRLSWDNVFSLFRTAEALNVQKLISACARFLALQLDEALTGRPDLAELIAESAFTIRNREVSDSIPVVEAIVAEIRSVFGSATTQLPAAGPLLRSSPLWGHGAAWSEFGRQQFAVAEFAVSGRDESPGRAGAASAPSAIRVGVEGAAAADRWMEPLPEFDVAQAAFARDASSPPLPEAVRRIGLLAEVLAWMDISSSLQDLFAA